MTDTRQRSTVAAKTHSSVTARGDLSFVSFEGHSISLQFSPVVGRLPFWKFCPSSGFPSTGRLSVHSFIEGRPQTTALIALCAKANRKQQSYFYKFFNYGGIDHHKEDSCQLGNSSHPHIHKHENT